MTNERERLARQWAEFALSVPGGSPGSRAAAEHVMATTTDPTMSNVEWSDDEHHLAGATTPKGHDAVMMWCDEEDTGHIVTDLGEWRPDQLTPNGKKYKLVEVTNNPEHPETLSTAEDYKDAPVGTIVAYNGFFPYVKKGRDVWTDTFDDKFSDDLLSGVSRQVLRWGWGE